MQKPAYLIRHTALIEGDGYRPSEIISSFVDCARTERHARAIAARLNLKWGGCSDEYYTPMRITDADPFIARVVALPYIETAPACDDLPF
jgi:hypothetical protein